MVVGPETRAILRVAGQLAEGLAAAHRRGLVHPFEQRYSSQIKRRQVDLDRLKQSVQQLERDLQRRSAAKDRVVELQLQSVQLAAEGLLDLSEIQGMPNKTDNFAGGANNPASSGFGSQLDPGIRGYYYGSRAK